MTNQELYIRLKNANNHVSGMLRRSGLLTQLEQHMTAADGTVFSLYGDPAYPLRPHLMAPFRGAVLTAEQQAFNEAMSALRVCVEWGFGKVVMSLLDLWQFDLKIIVR